MHSDFIFRTIKQNDNPQIAKIIRDSLVEYGENKPGTAFANPATDIIYETIQEMPKSVYYIVEYNGEVVGGSGIYPSKGLPDGYAELIKIYLKKEYRGKGLGKQLMEKCINAAREFGYTHLYLESFSSLREAVQLYYRYGFEEISAPLGDPEHFACETWMVKNL